MRIFYFLLLLLCVNNLSAQVSNLSFVKIDSLIASKTNKPFNGIILIGNKGGIAYQKVYGLSDIYTGKELQIRDQFVVGSISKQFTAVLVLKEYEKGHVELDKPIHVYLPELTQSWADSVTIHHLLTHMHGVVALDKPTLFPVGTQYAYSQIGYDLLSQIVEKTSGKTFAEQSAELFGECDMKDTFHPETKEYTSLVKGYTENADGEIVFDETSFLNCAAAGSFISTAVDLLKWNTSFYGGKLLTKETMRFVTTEQDGAVRSHPIFGKTAYGYGITVDRANNLLQLGQTGFAPGFVSMNFYFPDSQTSVIVLENIVYDADNIQETFRYHTEILNNIREQLQSNIIR